MIFELFTPYSAVNTLYVVYKTNHWILCREAIAVWPEIHIKHINAPCWKIVELLNVRPGGADSGNH